VQVERQDLVRLGTATLPQPPVGLDACIEQALASRLDYATARDEVEDAVRAAKVAANAMLPKLDLGLTATPGSPHDEHIRGPQWENGIYSGTVSSELPLDRSQETVSYRQALLNRDRRQRDLDQKRDQIAVEIRSDWRALETAAEDYRIQQLSLELARRRVESTELLFQAGRVNMRDVLESRDALTRTENAVTQSLVTHRMGWLRLLNDLELLPTEPETLWSPALELSQSSGPKDRNPE
jgi:outer membrane protein TolC